MAIQARYDVYEPVGGKWRFLFGALTVNKAGGAVEMLEDHIKTGPDARIAMIYDTEKNRHVPMFRVNIANQTQIKALSGGWKDGDGGIFDNLFTAQIEELAEQVSQELLSEPELPQDELESIEQDDEDSTDSVITEDPRFDVDSSPYDYEGQPDFVILNWMTGSYTIEQYVIPRPTERQMKALYIAHGNFIGASNTNRVESALTRIMCAVISKAEHVESLVEENSKLGAWVQIWREHLMGENEPLRFEGSTIEFINCGILE